MNKKFSTLMAAFLLAANVGTFTADAVPFNKEAAYTAATGSTEAKGKGYETGKSYLLQVEDGKYLAVVKNSDGKYGLKVVENSSMNGLDDLKTMMWTVSVNSQVGSKTAYTFVNNYAQIVLAADVNTAKANTDDNLVLNVLAGGITEWFSAPSYKEPTASQPLYANAGNDKVIVLKHDASSNNVYAVLVKASEFDPADTDADYLTITPYVATNYVLSANDLNTMLGAAGPVAKEGSYFTLNFDPAMESIFTDSKLQAVKVENKELEYGSTTDYSTGDYASLKEVDNAYRNTTGGYVALKNLKGEYIVADTAYIAGTDNNSNGLIKFTTDGLYNSKDDTRLRQPGSYLFKFLYNPSDGTVDIRVQSYIRKSKDYLKKAALDASSAKITNNETTFYASYDKKFVQLGSYWANVDAYDPDASEKGGLVADVVSGGTTTEATNVFITRALLGETNYATLGEQTPASVGTESNIINITLGAKNIYKPVVMAQGAYLLQVAGSINKQDIGKYWVNNLVGGWELAEQAIRQNYQHMPAAQWVLVNTGSAAAIYNREFEGKASSGILYGVEGHADQAFFMGGDTLKFIPVADAMNKYLGYKFVEDKNLEEQLFTFNYLHDLAMDKPINTINNKDSVVWVDKNGEDMKFVLEKLIDDEYGFNGDLKNVSALNRRVYYVRVKDATKLKNNGRYLAYDAQLKKYVVSNDFKTPFFLKENNEVEGGDCYYTLLTANCVYVGNIATKEVVRDDEGREYIPGLDVTPVKVNETTWYAAGTVTDADLQVVDNDIVGSFAADKGTVFNASGIAVEGIVPNVYYETKNYVDFINNIPLTTELEVNANGWKVTTGNDNTMANRKVKAETGFSVGNASETATVYVTKDSEGNEFVLVYHRLVRSNSQYATDKVSVDNNTLALVNGELSDSYWSEVANSAFAVKPSDDLLYRYFATTDTVKIYRVNASEKEFLYEDATSKYSKDKDFNFLGVEDKGLTKNAALFLDTAYVNRGTQMPQYMLAVRPTIQKADTILCDAENHKHPTLEDALACPHTSIKPACVKAYYLVNLVDSVAAENDRLEGALINKYLLDNTKYTRLGFVEATHIGDSLIIANSIYTGNATQINPADSTTWASRDTINLSGNTHNPAVFSFRKVSADNNDFLIESESWGDLNGNNVKGETIAEQFAGKIAPSVGGWVKIQNGVPVIANGDYRESATEAEIFNIETTTEAPTANEGISASEVSIVAGNGVVVVKNAAGKNVAISNILGKSIANVVLSSDNETISVPAGIVVVSVEGEEAVKAVVK